MIYSWNDHEWTTSNLDINVGSVIHETKKIQLQNLINKLNPDIISLNETYLKAKNDLVIDGYNIIRADRQIKIGGGAALCIKSAITAKINPTSFSPLDKICRITIKTKNSELAIFTIYSPPKAALCNTFCDYATKKHKHFIIVGDFNAKNRLWHCSSDNQ